MIKDISVDLDKLSERCDEIDIRKENNEMRQIILDLKDTLREHKDGVGLAANQIGYDKRIFVINFNGDLRTFINPIIAKAKGLTINREGCLSLPGKQFIRLRNTEILVTYQTPIGKIESRKMVGMSAFVFQHELEHLDGITLADIGLELVEGFDELSEEDKDVIIREYMDSLDLRAKEVSKQIEEDPELKKQSDAIKFMEAVQRGEVEFGESVTEVKKSENK